MKKHNNSLKQSEAPAQRSKLGVVVERKPQGSHGGAGRETGRAVGCGDSSGS
jgi:hypothetical protein